MTYPKQTKPGGFGQLGEEFRIGIATVSALSLAVGNLGLWQWWRSLPVPHKSIWYIMAMFSLAVVGTSYILADNTVGTGIKRGADEEITHRPIYVQGISSEPRHTGILVTAPTSSDDFMIGPIPDNRIAQRVCYLLSGTEQSRWTGRIAIGDENGQNVEPLHDYAEILSHSRRCIGLDIDLSSATWLLDTKSVAGNPKSMSIALEFEAKG